ncbi:MAG: deoxyguanosinetriphosphate triphosphohydrolase [Deinococcales bacterium]
MRTRADLERIEADSLAPYAVQAAQSKGRLFSEPESAFRTAFQKDRDRVIHTSAFRRLEYKTQVFTNTQGDYYRTRLTHTLEVAQVGRTIARALGVNEDLTETIALSHDLGHPPFGHAGEKILDALLEQYGGFDHNKQSFRVVTKLEKRYQDFEGLNLAWETLEGIVKHETEYDVSDAKDFEPTWRASLEAQIANLADETAYNAHDLDDGLRSGLLEPRALVDVAIWRKFTSELGFNPEYVSEFERRVLIRELLGWVISDIVQTSNQNLVGIHSLKDVRSAQKPLIAHSEEARNMLGELKKFLYQNFYYHYRVMRQVHKAEHILTSLYKAFTSRPNMMPNSHQARVEKVGLERAVCDYLAGMTDRFAMDEFNKLFEPFERT